MRIEKLLVRNFKGFKEKEFTFSRSFNLLVGTNGTGKTSVLDALSVATGSWLLGFKGRYGNRAIQAHEPHLTLADYSGEVRLSEQYPVEIRAWGEVLNTSVEWVRQCTGEGRKTTTAGTKALRMLAAKADQASRNGEEVVLPVISYYGTMRLWLEPKQLKANSRLSSIESFSNQKKMSRQEGYRFSVDPRISVKELVMWFGHQAWIEFQEERPRTICDLVKKEVLGCLEGASELRFDAKRGELVVDIDGIQPFVNLSDGQRSILAIVADLAQKCAKLNPHLGEKVLDCTPGIVLIDELDLHLHPRWQRRLIEDLRRIFPQVQFIATTHSPFLIQTLRDGEELIMLEGQPVSIYGNKGIEEIARGLMGVKRTDVSPRYEEMVEVAGNYLELLEKAEDAPENKLEQFKNRLAESIAPFADNPAFQAFLEMNRVAKLGVLANPEY
ncbi:MAG: AAA family ATPase [Gammaproteobacteria bacterium]|nr:AAA family ATPase [Gammaproteobacteria bacterium]